MGRAADKDVVRANLRRMFGHDLAAFSRIATTRLSICARESSQRATERLASATPA
jgi:hypothetical protein